MKTLFENMSEGKRAFIAILIICVVGFLAAYLTGGLLLSLALALLVIVAVYLTRFIWFSPDHGKGVIRKLSLVLAFSAIVGYSWWGTWVNSWLIQVIRNNTEWAVPDLPNAQPLSALSCVFLLLVIFVVNYFMRDTSAMKVHEKAIAKDFPEKNCQEND